jgi:hypothetical protein
MGALDVQGDGEFLRRSDLVPFRRRVTPHARFERIARVLRV